MVIRIALVFIFFATISCKKESLAPTEMLSEKTDTSAKLVAGASFVNGPYGTVSGKGAIYKSYDGTYSVVLDSFKTNNGPDLYVYVSQQAMPVDFIEAGKLKSTNGKQVYALSTIPDLSTFKYISIHCKAYNHLFGYALLN